MYYCGVVDVMLSHPPLSPLKGGCDITKTRPHSPLYPSYAVGVLCVCGSMLCDIVLTITPLPQSMEGTYHGLVCVVVLGAHLVQEGNGPCKIPDLSHLLWSYGPYMYFVGHVRIDPDKVKF